MDKIREKNNLVGRRFGKLTVTSYAGKDNTGKNSKWNCICDCGKESIVGRPTLIKEEFKKCTCTVFIRKKREPIISPKTRFNKCYTIKRDCWEWTRPIGTN